MVTNGERDGTLRRVADLFLTLLNGLNEEKEVEFTGENLGTHGEKRRNPLQIDYCEGGVGVGWGGGRGGRKIKEELMGENR